MDRELEATVKRSGACQYHSKSPPEAPLHPWAVPDRPWSRPHLDFQISVDDAFHYGRGAGTVTDESVTSG